MKAQFPCFSWGQTLQGQAEAGPLLELCPCLVSFPLLSFFLPSLTGFAWVYFIKKSLAYTFLSQGLILRKPVLRHFPMTYIHNRVAGIRIIDPGAKILLELRLAQTATITTKKQAKAIQAMFAKGKETRKI